MDRKAAFIFVGDLNAHHQEWLGSVSGTDRHSVAAYDFLNLSGCVQFTNEPTYRLDNCLGLLLSDAPEVLLTLYLETLIILLPHLLFNLVFVSQVLRFHVRFI